MALADEISDYFTPEVFGQTEAQFAARVARAEAKATLAAPGKVDAQLQHMLWTLYGQQEQFLRNALTSISLDADGGVGTVQRSDLAARIASTATAKESARVAFLALTVVAPEPEPEVTSSNVAVNVGF